MPAHIVILLTRSIILLFFDPSKPSAIFHAAMQAFVEEQGCHAKAYGRMQRHRSTASQKGMNVVQVNGPSVYKTYLAAAQNLGLSNEASGYWELHIKEDERHGRQMVEDVALPLVDMYASCSLSLHTTLTVKSPF